MKNLEVPGRSAMVLISVLPGVKADTGFELLVVVTPFQDPSSPSCVGAMSVACLHSTTWPNFRGPKKLAPIAVYYPITAS